MGIEAIYAPFTTSIEEFLTERGGEFDVVYVTRYNVAQQVLDTVRRLAPKAKILFCNADLHFLRELREAISSNNQDAVLNALTTRDQELDVMRRVDVTLSYNTTEHAVIMSHNLSSTKIATCPWVVDVVDEVPGFDARQDVAFLGGFGHPPNRSAVLFFIQQVMPLLRKRVPGLRFRVYGSRVPDEIRALASEDVLIEGYVEDVAEVYNGCRVFVAPLLTGAGIKGKVIDGLAYGTPSVLSPIAAEGTGVRQGIDALVAETPEEWADAVACLYTDQMLWEALSKHSREQARAVYSFDKGKALMRKALEMAGIYVPDTTTALVPLRARV
jgi:glycosyltransferase involved in cell wall biosynthesis